VSDDPRPLRAQLLDKASTEQQREFAKMLAEECAIADKQHTEGKDWLFLPTPTEYEKIRPYTQPPNYDKCPKCGKGRVILEIYHGNVGDSLHLVCKWGQPDCDFKEYVSDPS
jgi:hypothetical protein